MIRKVYNYLKERCGHYLSKRPVSRWPMILRVRQAMRQYNANEGHTFDLSAPKLFTEKIVWYKLFYRHRDMTRIYDKYLFKDYIAESRLYCKVIWYVDGRARTGTGLGQSAGHILLKIQLLQPRAKHQIHI